MTMDGFKVSADRFLLARAPAACYSCGCIIDVFMVILEPGHRIEDESGCVEAAAPEFGAVTWIYAMNGPALAAVAENAPHWRLGHSHTLEAGVFMNHCPECNAHQGDFYLTKPDGPFWPFDQAEADKISLVRLSTHIEASCMSYSEGIQFEISDGLQARIPKPPEPRPKKSKPKR